MNTTKTAKCRNCDARFLVWKQNKAGKWYLADENVGIRGSRYYSPHYLTCEGKGPRADQLRATAEHNAKVEADRAAARAKIDALIANGGTVAELADAGASFNDMVAAGVTVEQLTDYYAGR